MATHSSVLAWKIPWSEEPGPGVTESDTTEHAGWIADPAHSASGLAVYAVCTVCGTQGRPGVGRVWKKT